jgi:hypothetical protein
MKCTGDVGHRETMGQYGWSLITLAAAK